ncbi:hypothetical protein BS47DRAFT_1353061 [Hydnum rufescens UP504]|uniref:Uncharacterized protein n=1 Tax=Hydnum rufescens UP504 TaxID=1448309 RepID=A0A9P6AI63_9AGAM|nr:hypothetical protein BS47DRAFT_1353061 [Hydnum rufescens UP504]
MSGLKIMPYTHPPLSLTFPRGDSGMSSAGLRAGAARVTCTLWGGWPRFWEFPQTIKPTKTRQVMT